jgi:hypothetical protein
MASLLHARTGWLGAAVLSTAAVVALGALGPGTANAKNRYALEPANVESKRAFRYAGTTSEDCLAELARRKFPFKLEPPTKQVDTPIRFTGPIRGVEFKLTTRAEKDPDKTSPSAVADCRLALAIDDFAKVLRKHKVKKVEYLSMYRKRGVGFIRPGKRHPAGLAIDVATLTTDDDKTYSVYRDWHGRVGSKTCGDGARPPTKDTPGSRLMRGVICDLVDVGSFNLVLTPHYDWGHRDHFHLEVRTGIRWFLNQ